jgi:hypothetical protein
LRHLEALTQLGRRLEKLDGARAADFGGLSMAAAAASEVTDAFSTSASSSVSGALMVSVLSLPSQLTLSRTGFGTLLRSGFSAA